MKAGRELDFKIYTEVMGFEDWETDKTYWQKEIPPEYSTDISAAWRVVEKMITTKGISYVGIKIDPVGALCEIFADDMELIADEETTTAPLAICRAALKAVEND